MRVLAVFFGNLVGGYVGILALAFLFWVTKLEGEPFGLAVVFACLAVGLVMPVVRAFDRAFEQWKEDREVSDE